MEAIRKAYAAKLYEGRKVRCNHPDKPSDHRDVDDTLGWLEHIEVRDDGLYGDLCYLESHPMSARLVEAAERNPNLFGLSHNANGDVGSGDDGVQYVKEIFEVRSVDLVDRPATTFGLFESVQNQGAGAGEKPMPVKLKDLIERITNKPKRKILDDLVEMGAMDPSMDVDMSGDLPEGDAPMADHEMALKDGFSQSISAIVEDCLSGGGLSADDGMKKIRQLLKAHEKLTAKKDESGSGDGTDKEVEEDDEAGAGDSGGDTGEDSEDSEDVEEGAGCDPDDKGDKSKKGKGKDSMESREQKLAKREKAHELLEQAGIPIESILVKSLMGLETEADMNAMIAREKKMRAGGNGNGKPPATPATKAPRSGSGGGGNGRLNLTEHEKNRLAVEDEVVETISFLRN
jgi:hypothetical protein